ncbi:thermonuclease family protein [Pokkaliibacter sp. MBI-7]|nr:thermonuclease family protein [Pokkaliibacter sp. MBI-7]MDH2436855.1 thermonuclease family protein [Pokkaliibacter sp. MBI-7]
MIRPALFALAILASLPAAAGTQSLSVIDGDTVRYNGQRLRLLSIDTPETYKPRCDAELTKGREATARLRELVANAQRIEVVDSGQADKYDRRLVHLLIDGRDVGQTLMAEGLAVEWRPGPNAWRERRRHWCGY